MTQNKNIPKLRFPEFSDEWQTKTLGEVCEINPKKIGELPSSFIYIDLESVVSGLLIKEKNILKIDAPSRAQRVLVKKDILFQMVRPYQKNNLFFDKNGNYVASTGYAQIRTKQNPQFIFQHLHNQKFIDEVILNCSGTTYPAINSTDLGNITVNIPSFPEQEKIAAFFSLLDKKIDLQRQKVKNAEMLLKGFSQQLFSQQLRFKDNNGKHFPKWETKTLGEVGEKSKEVSTKNNQYPILTSARTGIYFQKDYFNKEVASENNTGYNVVPRGYITYRSVSDNISFTFNINTICDKGIVSPIYPVFTVISGNNYFIKMYLNEGKIFKKFALSQQQGGTRTALSFNTLSKLCLPLPSLAEQEKIAAFLSLLDKKVEIEKKLLKNIEQQKKYFLQNMFV